MAEEIIENINLLESFYLPKLENDTLKNSSVIKILNDNQIDSYEAFGIDKDKDAGLVNLQYKDEKEKQTDGISFAEGLLEFAKDIIPSSVYSVGLAGVNGADVMLNFIPLFDRLFSLDPNYETNQPLMDKMKDWDKNLANARKHLNDKRDENQKVAKFVSMIFQDVPYAIPLHKAFKKTGMPKWMSMPLAYGMGYALGFDEKHVSMFINSKDMQALKHFVKILPDTPESKLFDNMWQTFEGTSFAWMLPELWKGFKFAKRNIPKVSRYVSKDVVSDAAKVAAASTVMAGSVIDKAQSNPVIAKEIIKYGGKKLKKIFHQTDKNFKDFDINKTGDKSVWFTDDIDLIKNNKIISSGKGNTIERILDENKLKLATASVDEEKILKYSSKGNKEGGFGTTSLDKDLKDQGYDGVKYLTSEGFQGGNAYRIFNPEKLSKK